MGSAMAIQRFRQMPSAIAIRTRRIDMEPAEPETDIPSLTPRVGVGPAEPETDIPPLARFDVALSGIPPRRGNDMSAQGIALGTGIPRKRMPERAPQFSALTTSLPR
jgi:hypothetical protein